MNVLITSVSRKVALVRAFQKALAEEGGGKVVAVDCNPHAAGLYVADVGHLVPEAREPGFVRLLLRLCEEERIGVVVPTRDEDLPLLAENRDAFTRVGAIAMVPGADTVRLCQDKKSFLGHLAAHGFSGPRTFESSGSVGEADLPVFVKPRRGKGSSSTTRADTLEELEAAVRKVPDPIVQELVEAPEYTVDLFADFEGHVISAVPRQRIQVFGGESFVGRTIRDPRLIEESVQIARSLELRGHNTLQCFLRDGRVLWIEVNPRYGGAASLGFAAGAPTPQYLVRAAQGKPVEPRLGEFREGLVMLRYTEDLFLEAPELKSR